MEHMGVAPYGSSNALVSPQTSILQPHGRDIQIHEIPEVVGQFMDPHAITSVEEYIQKSEEEIRDEFLKKNTEFEQCGKDLPNIVDPLGYSLCQKKMEEISKEMKNMLESLRLKGCHNDVGDLEPITKERAEAAHQAFALRPLGPSVLLPSDQERLKKISSVANNETYDTSIGRFYEPKVSHLALMSAFEGLKRERGYASITVGWKVHEIYNHELNHMCTYVAFEKSKEQAEFDLKQLKGPSAGFLCSVNNNAALKATQAERHSFFGNFGRDLVAVLSSKPLPEQQLQIMAERNQENCQNAVQRIVPDLQAKVQEWNFAGYEIIGSVDASERFGISQEEAMGYEYIVFQHRKQ